MSSSSSTSPPPTRARSRSTAGSTAGSVNGLTAAAAPAPPVPSPNATHSSFIPTRYIKHASLINNCYPSKPDEKGPKSSELSYLVFYATSKPAKLTKVGNFIERKVVKDYKKKQYSSVHCSLEIIKSLLLASKAHLNIFSKNIVSILDALLVDISDLDIVRHCQNVFSCFCSAHDGSTLGVDVEFRTIYDRVVSRFAGIATLQNSESANRYRMIGLRALEAVVSSHALYACDTQAQLNLVLPAILERLIEAKNGVNVPLTNSEEAPSIRRSVSIHVAVHPDNVVSDEDVTQEALRCLRALFKSPNGGNVRLALGSTFTYLDENSIWWPSTFGVGIIKAIVTSILPQYRYMVVNEIITRIDGVDSTTSEANLRLQKKATLISALNAILVSPITLIGMPVLEVLNSLLIALTKSLSGSANVANLGGRNELLTLESQIQEELIKSVGGLATHIYYSNQVPHIISHIAGKLSFKLGATPQPSSIEGVSTLGYRTALLDCLMAVIKTSKNNGRQEASFHAAEISSDLLTPCLGLLLDENVEIRSTFAQVLVTFLVAEDDSTNVNAVSSMTSPIPSTSGDLHFRAAAHQTLYAYASSSFLTPKDLVAIYGILKALFTHFQDDEFIRVVPMLFSLQDWCLQDQPSEEEQQDEAFTVARKRAIASVIVSYFEMAVSTYNMAEPLHYLKNITTSRQNESQWIPVQYYGSIEESLARATESSWDAPTEPLSPVLTHPLAREHLVTLLTTVSDRFRAGADRFGLVFTPESSLFSLESSTGSGLFLSSGTLNGSSSIIGHKVERSMDSRIRVSRHLEDWALPKIVSHFSNSSSELSTMDESPESRLSRDGSESGGLLTLNGGSSKKIGVDSLKAALAAAHMAADATSETGSSSTGSETRGASTTQRFYSLSVHAQSLRKQHSASASTGSNLTSRPDLADILNTIKVEGPRNSEAQLSLVVPPYM
ncbi:plasma membrane localization protein [Entomortierella lignicola]|nr:plasma membrane localization protein [Entomortierella lignicola]